MLIELLYISVVAVVCALLGLSTSRYSRGGLIVYLAFGFIGAFAGTYVSRALDFADVPDLTIGVTKFPVIWALVGAVLLIAAIGVLVKER
ncbi:MAG: hypothetical protein HXY20_11775 [Acidobacteria bacterium]|nr:hypothetical protein [Acidobacteriota bacterium]